MSEETTSNVRELPVKDEKFTMENMSIDAFQNKDDDGYEAEAEAKVSDKKVKVRKPRKGQEYIRTHPTQVLENLTVYYDDVEDRDYIILPVFQDSPEAIMIMQSAQRADFYPYTNVQGEFSLWKVNRNSNSWNRSARKLLEVARTEWTAYNSPKDRSSGDSEYTYHTSDKLPEVLKNPFPERDLADWIRAAFEEDQIIHNADHILVRRFNGEDV